MKYIELRIFVNENLPDKRVIELAADLQEDLLDEYEEIEEITYEVKEE